MASSRPETAGGAPWSKLQGQVVLVTGASSGLGREFCLDLARAGCRVVGAARRADRLRSLCDEINAAAQVPLAVAVGLDVAAGESSVEAAVLTAWDAFGRVDVLINNAGVREHLLCAPTAMVTKSTRLVSKPDTPEVAGLLIGDVLWVRAFDRRSPAASRTSPRRCPRPCSVKDRQPYPDPQNRARALPPPPPRKKVRVRASHRRRRRSASSPVALGPWRRGGSWQGPAGGLRF
ncbi:uncharacterized protein [Aegilops tauschii subsp. strangulata]|uniref:uncharacterized protein isoform X2 n=1 Tax=Aegilops tauschii subsp. strangulata TaxID=200361 RepID=UPI001ABC0DEF|nr:hydroxysteroid dehydrogenase-like protein 2 isoform X2 [Aegilops tauschii subsp. strangulata]